MPAFQRIAWAAVLVTFVVIVLGAFVRLSDAGLSCPDWPTCYGKITWPKHAHDVVAANEAFPERPVESHKAWREQVHRHVVAVLGLLVVVLALIANWLPRWRLAGIGVTTLAAATGTVLYIQGHAAASVVAMVMALAIPLLLALVGTPGRTSIGQDKTRQTPRPWARYTAFLLALIIFQAVLGMWTVTWKLKPVVVMAHLLGGFSVFALLVWIADRSGSQVRAYPGAHWLRPWVWFGLVVVIAQIALGGWTSANYAALACGTDFPRCLGQWWPATDFREAFVLWRGIGVDYEGGLLDAPARAAIQMAHRIGAVVTVAVVLFVVAALYRIRGLRRSALALLGLLVVQVALGISNVWFGLPLPVATAHNAVAALLVVQFVLVLSRLRSRGY